MGKQTKNLDRIRNGKVKGLPFSHREIEEAKTIISILETAVASGHTRSSLYKMFNGNPDYPPENGITPYPEKMYELKGDAYKGIYQIRIGSHSDKNRVRFRFENNVISILGIGDFHTMRSKKVT